MSDDKMPEYLSNIRESYLDLEYSKEGFSSKAFRDGFNLCFELISRQENLAKLPEVEAVNWSVKKIGVNLYKSIVVLTHVKVSDKLEEILKPFKTKVV